MRDPTHAEMYAFLASTFAGGDEDESFDFDIEEAIYWFASDYHGGQWSNLYSALCQSEFRPHANANAPETPLFYDALVEEYK